MFKFLKDKLKSAISVFTKKAEELPAEEVEEKKEEAVVEETKEELIVEKKPAAEPKKLESKHEIIEKKPVVKAEEKKVDVAKPKIEAAKPKVEEKKQVVEEKKVVEVVEKEIIAAEKKLAEPKKGFFAKLKEKFVEVVTTTKISDEKFGELFWELELAMLENNVAVEVIEKIKEDLKKEIVDKPITRGKVEDKISSALKESISGLFDVEQIDMFEMAKQAKSEKKPLVICFVGINGSGKTTTIAKMAELFQKNGFSTVLAAADTFRAAAIDQLQMHADKLKTKIIKQDYGSDAAAVAFDAIKHAQAARKDVVLIDTAGRLHSNINLVDEMKKIIRVAKPDLKIFVGESITGNDCIEQAKKFDEAIGIDGIVLSKADVDEKGGAAISVSYVTKKPILFIGTGQEYKDLKPFDSNIIVESLGL
jgi:fused signal recognition particle receptor